MKTVIANSKLISIIFLLTKHKLVNDFKLVLAIVGMFGIPMMPATKAATILQKGDIAICEEGPFDWIVRWYASHYWNKQVTWTHAACYVGSTSYSSSTVVETAKHGIYIIPDDIYGLINMGQATIVTSWQNQ